MKKRRTLTFVLHSITSFTAAATALSLMSISSMAFEKKENKSINGVYDRLVTIKRCNRNINDQMAPSLVNLRRSVLNNDLQTHLCSSNINDLLAIIMYV